jgi:hypothetical protein
MASAAFRAIAKGLIAHEKGRVDRSTRPDFLHDRRDQSS